LQAAERREERGERREERGRVAKYAVANATIVVQQHSTLADLALAPTIT